MFAGLSHGMLGWLADRCVAGTVGADQLLFAAGDECRGLYVVAAGRVRTFRVDSRGEAHRVSDEGPGRALDELSLVDGAPYAVSARTLEPTQLLFLPREAFDELCGSGGDAARAIVRALGRRLREMAQSAQALAGRDVTARLALLLAGYAERLGRPVADGGVELALGRTQEELGREIGTARESVSRAWGQLRDARLIEPRRGRRLHIPDIQRLRDVAVA